MRPHFHSLHPRLYCMFMLRCCNASAHRNNHGEVFLVSKICHKAEWSVINVNGWLCKYMSNALQEGTTATVE